MKQGFFPRFLGVYGFDKLPTGRRLREMMDNVAFCVEEWNVTG